MSTKKKYVHLSFEERFVIEKLYRAAISVRRIAEFLSRSPNTIAREIEKNMVNEEYVATKANVKVSQRRWRAKSQCLKVAMNRFLHHFVLEKLIEKWSPMQISGHLKQEFGIVCSAKAIYKFAESRGLERRLFWGWNHHKSGRKRGHWHVAHDGRSYIDARPALAGAGHFELDFIVSKESPWVLMVMVDRVTKRAWVRKLPNRKRATIRSALSAVCGGMTVQSITTDNDIAFTCWRELEAMLHTHIYFTHPYHSWEKGLVENTNRWIRCFVPKRRDVGSVTEEELVEIHSFLNDRPRACIGFRLPSVYDSTMRGERASVLLRG